MRTEDSVEFTYGLKHKITTLYSSTLLCARGNITIPTAEKARIDCSAKYQSTASRHISGAKLHCALPCIDILWSPQYSTKTPLVPIIVHHSRSFSTCRHWSWSSTHEMSCPLFCFASVKRIWNAVNRRHPPLAADSIGCTI